MTSIKTKRIYYESKILNQDQLNIATAYPFEDGMNIWYALFIGPHDSAYKGGHYICKIILSANYPFTPPDFIFLTPSGRFEINKKICLTITGFHSDMWQSTITIKTMLIQIFSVFYQDVDNGIAHLIPPASGTTKLERQKYAENSIAYNLANYKEIYQNFDFTYLNDGSLEEINKNDINKEINKTDINKSDINDKKINKTDINNKDKEINNNEINKTDINNNEINKTNINNEINKTDINNNEINKTNINNEINKNDINNKEINKNDINNEINKNDINNKEINKTDINNNEIDNIAKKKEILKKEEVVVAKKRGRPCKIKKEGDLVK